MRRASKENLNTGYVQKNTNDCKILYCYFDVYWIKHYKTLKHELDILKVFIFFCLTRKLG